MARKSKDYIPTEAETALERENLKQFMSDNPDPRHSYKATYRMLGIEYTENVMAFNAAEAEKHVKQQCSMVGIYPQNIMIEEA